MQGSTATTRHKLIPGMGVWSQYMELIMHEGMGQYKLIIPWTLIPDIQKVIHT